MPMDQNTKPKNEADFVTPTEAAAQDDLQSDHHTPPTVSGPTLSAHHNKKPRKHRFWPPRLTKKQWLTVGTVAAVVLVFGGYLTWKILQPKPQPIAVVQETPAEPEKPVQEKSKLTGLPVPTGTNKSTPVTAVMIENSPDARPQSGLKDAGVVYEAIAEGGITRFVAFFQEAKPDYIGPVRSVRPYYLDFIKPYDAPVAHAGGSGAALAIVRGGQFKDLDQFFYPDYYERISTRYAPHNLYTSRAKLLALQKTKGWNTSDFTGMTRSDEAKPSKNITAKAIDFSLSSYLYNPHYDYDASSNTYKRSEGGAPHTDEKSGKQLAPNVVIALVMPHHYEGIYSVYQTTGSGQAYIFQNGTVTKASWKKSSQSAQLSLLDANGKQIGLNPGQTWFTLVNSSTDVHYTP